MLKSQILAGGRGLGKFKSGLQGGVHICSVDEAPKLAEQMLGQVLIYICMLTSLSSLAISGSSLQSAFLQCPISYSISLAGVGNKADRAGRKTCQHPVCCQQDEACERDVLCNLAGQGNCWAHDHSMQRR